MIGFDNFDGTVSFEDGSFGIKVERPELTLTQINDHFIAIYSAMSRRFSAELRSVCGDPNYKPGDMQRLQDRHFREIDRVCDASQQQADKYFAKLGV